MTPRLSANVNHVVGIDHHEKTLMFADSSRQDASEQVIYLVEQYLSRQSNPTPRETIQHVLGDK